MALAGQWAPSPHGAGPDWRAAPRACPAANFAKPAGGRRPEHPGREESRTAHKLPRKGRDENVGCLLPGQVLDQVGGGAGQKRRTDRSSEDERLGVGGSRAFSSASWVAGPSVADVGTMAWKGLKECVALSPWGSLLALFQRR